MKEEDEDGDGWQYIDGVQPANDDEQMKNGSEAPFEAEHGATGLQQCFPQPRTDDRGEGAGAETEPQYRQLVNGMSVRLYRWMQGVGIGCQRKRKLQPPGS